MNQEALDKKKGIPDIVFLLDASGSMKECIDAVTQSIATFVDTLGAADANGGVLVQDWRIRVVGYRDRLADGAQWLVDNPFTNSVEAVKAQLAALQAKGGADEPESLLDALYALTCWAQAERGAAPDAYGWRHRHDATRVVVVFTDASFHPTFQTDNGGTGSVDDLIQACHACRLKVVLHAPDAPGYVDLSAMNGLEWEPVGALGANPVQALRDFTSDANQFAKVMEALAKTVSASAAVPVL